MTRCNVFPKGVHKQPEGHEIADNFNTYVVKQGDILKFKIEQNPVSVIATKMNVDGTIEHVEMEEKITTPSNDGYYIYKINALWHNGKKSIGFNVNVE